MNEKKRLFVETIILSGVLFLSALVLGAGKLIVYIASSRAEGRVLSISEPLSDGSSEAAPVIAFTSWNGKEIRFVSTCTAILEPSVGSKVTVFYNPLHPIKANLSRCLVPIVEILMILGALWIYGMARKKLKGPKLNERLK